MAFVDRHDPDAKAADQRWQRVEINPELELAQPAFDRNLPEACDAQMRLCFVIRQERGDPRPADSLRRTIR
jgi:hypothetical protein